MIYDKTNDSKKIKISMCINEQNWEKISDLAIRSDCSYSYVVNHILKQYFSEKDE